MPWTHRFSHRTDVAAEALWAVLADVAGWPAIDRGIADLRIDEEPRVGAEFALKPHGGPRIRFSIERFEPPREYADRCCMPGASMTTVHRLTPDGEGTLMEIEIHVRGPLAPLWGRLVGRKHARGLGAQTERLVSAARERERVR
ncbi:MAG: SRPBCC family protein [Planctomycetota bacterium]